MRIGPWPGAPSRGHVGSACGLGLGKVSRVPSSRGKREFEVFGPNKLEGQTRAPGAPKRNSEGKTVFQVLTLSLEDNLPALRRTRRNALRSPGAPSSLQRLGSFSPADALSPLDPWLDSAYRDSVPNFTVKGGEAEGGWRKEAKLYLGSLPKWEGGLRVATPYLSQTSPSTASFG